MRRNAMRPGVGAVAGGMAAVALLAGCGGGGGSGAARPRQVDDPIVVLSGPTGRLSRTIDEANDDNGATPPPTLPPTVTTGSHWIRLEFPTPIARADLLENSVFTAPFSYLNGAITITDLDGDHLPGLALVNGVDALGVSHAADPDFPHDVQGTVDRNLGANVFLYIADADRDLSTYATFGFALDTVSSAKLEIADVADHQNGPLDTVRITVAEIGGYEWNAVWSFSIGAAPDARRPFVVRARAEERSPTDPLNDAAADVGTTFLIEFSEPMIPKRVGDSPLWASAGFNGNTPRPPRTPPLPNTAIVATINTALGTLMLPFDCRPLSSNNLATYRLRPLVELPPLTSVDVVVRAVTINTDPTTFAADAATDLAGNAYDGQDADLDGVPDAVDFTRSWTTGPGAALVNIPVSPEVVYWLPVNSDGIGALDLNGRGITTNAPGANAGNRDRAIIITSNWLNVAGCEVNPGGLNLSNGQGLIGYPGSDLTPLDPCTGVAMLEFGHNRYTYPFGTGSFPYGPGPNASRGESWHAPNDPGNPGTPLPGVNEGSSGFETLCRDSSGDIILTGRQFGRVGVLNDLIVGDFLDVVYFDQQNNNAATFLHKSMWNGPFTGRGNTISDPPTPNPPPLRFWLGLPEVASTPNFADPDGDAVLIEGEEVFVYPIGRPNLPPIRRGYAYLKSSRFGPNHVDEAVFPFLGHGPGEQSCTATFTYGSRQQIGNFLYATDATNGVVQVINSNTMRVIDTISTPDPTGLAIAPDMSRIYVTNFDNDDVSVIATNPLGDDFHREIARIPVGSGPRAICVQPEHEEILVCNYGGNTVSLISGVDLSIRRTLDQLISGPWDVEAAPRQITPFSPSILNPTQIGWACGVYFAYVSNSTGNSVVVYESGPDGPQGIGIDNVRGALPEDDSGEELISPRGLCYDPFPNASGLYAGGCFVAHRDSDGHGRVSEIQFTQQAVFGPLPIVVPPGFLTPPGFLDRVFEIVRTWGNLDNARLAGEAPSDVALCDLNSGGWRAENRTSSSAANVACTSTPPVVDKTGALNSKHPMRLNVPTCYPAVVPDRLYVAFEDVGVIQVLDPTLGAAIRNTISDPGIGGVKKLMTYFRQ